VHAAKSGAGAGLFQECVRTKPPIFTIPMSIVAEKLHGIGAAFESKLGSVGAFARSSGSVKA
jgi:hypothetical protein